LSFRRGRPRSIVSEVPAWLESLFEGTKFEIRALREALGPKPRKNDRSRER
jgi:hypothetical protein